MNFFLPSVLHNEFQVILRREFNRILNVGYRCDINNGPRYSSLEAYVTWRSYVAERITLRDPGRIDDWLPIDELECIGDTGTEMAIIPIVLDRRTCSRIEARVTNEAHVPNRAWVG